MLKKKRLGDKCDLDYLFFETSNYGQLFVKEESTGTTIKKDKDMSDKSTDWFVWYVTTRRRWRSKRMKKNKNLDSKQIVN